MQLDDTIDLVDLEEYAKKGDRPPKAKKYRIRIDKERYEVKVPKMTGRQLLELAGKVPEQYQIFQKLRGSLDEIKLNDVADFTTPGVERFVTLPLDQGEG